MGIDIQQYRLRIGLHCAQWRPIVSSIFKFDVFKFFGLLGALLFICLLLLIAGIEPNPGPTTPTGSPPTKRRATGRPRVNPIKLRGKNEARSELRNRVNTNSEYVKVSLQCCNVASNVPLLNSLSKKTSSQKDIDKLNGLIAVFEELTAKSLSSGNSHAQNIISMEYAFEIYLGFKTDYVPDTETANDRTSFQENLLHPQYGLRVYIINLPFTKERYIVLRPGDVDLTGVFSCFIAHSFLQDSTTDSRFPIRPDILQSILATIDTEWDRKVARVILSANRSRTEIEALGMDSHEIVSATRRVLDAATEWENTKVASADIVKSRLCAKVSKLTEEINELDELLVKKRGQWSEGRIQDIEEKRSASNGSLCSFKKLLETETCVSLQHMVIRQAKQLFEQNRVKRRKLSSQGRPLLIDSDDEDFMSKAIEDKSSYHGRRSDLVMYTNKRVKKRDLKNIVNFHRNQKGKKLIKSSTTAYNRSRPKSLRSHQSKKHLGKGLFCFKKPPKAEDQSNENTHYQRAHVNNIKMFFFSERQLQYHKLCFMRSTDDKAYIRPGTSEGLEKTRNIRILTLSDVSKARKLPKYDWPERLVYITPGSHRIFTKKGVVDDEGKETLITENDFHFVVVRPKAVIGSSGSVWASETVRLRQEYPDAFELQNETEYSVAFRRCCSLLRDSLHIYVDMTEKQDLEKITNHKECAFTSYEINRALCIQQQINKATENFELSDASEAERTLLDCRISPKLQQIMVDLTNLLFMLRSTKFEPRKAIEKALSLKDGMCDLMERFPELNLPRVKPRWADLTDAGPGVGVSNFSVRFRDAEIARLYNSDYRVRCHRSRGDSGQGEAERTNSAIGDAVVDGGTVEWEVVKRFEDLTEEEVETMTVQDYEEYERKRMEKNAWFVAENITRRTDDTPVLSNYIKAFISGRPEDAFFVFEDLIQKFQKSTSAVAKGAIPGSAYIQKILSFYENHYIHGELFMEFIKGGCVDATGELCEYCQVNEWIGEKMTRIPQPVPDPERPSHYLSVFETSHLNEQGKPREPDDWQPRAQIKRYFQKGEITVANQEKITEFAQKYCVEEALVKIYLEHLQELDTLTEIRSRSRKEERKAKKEKSYDQYDWLKLAMDGGLKGLKVLELNKYLGANGLTKAGKKEDKIKAIACHVIRTFTNSNAGRTKIQQNLQTIEEESETQKDSDTIQSDSSDDDELLGMVSDDSSESNEGVQEFDKHESDDEFEQLTVTRSGRVVGSWKNSFF